MARARGRQSNQLRTLVCELSTLERCDGSAKWTQDGTSVLAAVYGPKQVQQRKEDSEKAIVEVVFKPRSGVQGPLEKQYEATIREALEGILLLGAFPRTSIMIVLQVLADDGGLLAVALNAACAALVDAGVLMKSMFSAVSCSVISEDGSRQRSLVLDPDASEEERSRLTLTLAFAHGYSGENNQAPDTEKGGEITAKVEQGALLCQTAGGAGQAPISTDDFMDVFDACRAACAQLAQFQRTAVVKALG